MIRPSDIARTWAVPKELAAQISDLADELQVSPSHLVVRLLQYALAAVDRGELVFYTRVVARELVDADDEKGGKYW